MRRALAKPHLCVVGVDDGAFTRRRRYAPLAAVVLRTPATVDAVALDRVRVDGDDATEVIERLVRGAPGFEGVRAVLLDGIVVGGFNVVDLPRLRRRLRRPVVAVTRRPPDRAKIRAALRKYFPDSFRRRWRRIESARLFPVATGGKPIWAAISGGTRDDARALVARSAVVGYWPEALRLAHLFARAEGLWPASSGPDRPERPRPKRPSLRSPGAGRAARRAPPAAVRVRPSRAGATGRDGEPVEPR